MNRVLWSCAGLILAAAAIPTSPTNVTFTPTSIVTLQPDTAEPLAIARVGLGLPLQFGWAGRSLRRL